MSDPLDGNFLIGVLVPLRLDFDGQTAGDVGGADGRLSSVDMLPARAGRSGGLKTDGGLWDGGRVDPDGA